MLTKLQFYPSNFTKITRIYPRIHPCRPFCDYDFPRLLPASWVTSPQDDAMPPTPEPMADATLPPEFTADEVPPRLDLAGRREAVTAGSRRPTRRRSYHGHGHGRALVLLVLLSFIPAIGCPSVSTSPPRKLRT